MSEEIDPGAVLVERQGHVLIATINRPDARNAVNESVWVGLGQALETAEQDRDVWAVIVTGAGDKAFCAGADLKALSQGRRIAPADPVQQAWGFAGYVQHAISKPTIAAVNGSAMGGGTEITLASDLAVACEEATFGLPEVRRGIIAGAGGAFRLAQQVPRKVAMQMLLTGEPITAARALELDLINAVVPRADLMDAALELARRICVNAPLAVQATKRVAAGIDDAMVPADAEDWRRSGREAGRLMRTADAREGPRAFAEKRDPVWTAQ